MKKRHVFLAHAIFWIMVIGVEATPMAFYEAELKLNVLVQILFMLLFGSFVFYFCYLFLAPRLLSTGKIFLFIVALAAFVFFFAWVLNLFYPKILFLIVEPTQKQLEYKHWYFSLMTHCFIYSLWGTMLRFTVDWFIGKQKNKELEKQSIATELALLRSQINPHFLFNTLNNVHSYVYREPEKASFGIIRLSEIMRYMLYEANADKVPLEKEISHIHSYIALQKLRHKDPNYIEFKTEGDCPGMMIPPMLLMPFVENAFKHGSKKNTAPGVMINLSVSNNQLHFVVENAIGEPSFNQDESNGIGLKNIRRRLELLYPGEHLLDISENNNIFRIELKLACS